MVSGRVSGMVSGIYQNGRQTYRAIGGRMTASEKAAELAKGTLGLFVLFTALLGFYVGF